MTLKEFHKLLLSSKPPVFCKCGDYYVKTTRAFAFDWANEQIRIRIGKPFFRFNSLNCHVFIGEDPSLDIHSQEITL